MMKKPMYGHGKKTKMKKYAMGKSIEMGKRPGMMGGKGTSKMVEMEQDKVKRLYGGGKTK